jgi:uncharacterized protein (DUF362 family)
MNKISRRSFLYLIALTSLALCSSCTDNSEKEGDSSVSVDKFPRPLKSSTDIYVYSSSDISKAIDELPEHLTRFADGRRIVSSGDRVLIKPNLVVGRRPEYAANTHPLLVAKMVEICKDLGAREVIVTDNPTSDARNAFLSSGMKSAVEKAGGRVVYLNDYDFVEVKIKDGVSLKTARVAKIAFEVDVMVNMPIAKHHGLAGITASLKNMMGLMADPRGFMHIEFPEKICDLNQILKPSITILDATRVLLRNGPTGGNLQDVEVKNTVVIGTDPVKVDSLAALLIGNDPLSIPHLVRAEERGLGKIIKSVEEVEKHQ